MSARTLADADVSASRRMDVHMTSSWNAVAQVIAAIGLVCSAVVRHDFRTAFGMWSASITLSFVAMFVFLPRRTSAKGAACDCI